jgi:hypothetical protein
VSRALLEHVAAARHKVTARLGNEVTGIKNDSVPLTKFAERKEPQMVSVLNRKLKGREVDRLEAIIAELRTSPQSEFAPGILEANPMVRADLGRKRLPFGRRDEAGRKALFFNLGKKMDVLVSANNASCETFAFVDSVRRHAPLRVWKVQRFCFVAELMWENIISKKMFNNFLGRMQQRRYRLAIPAAQLNSPEQRTFFATLRNVFRVYNAEDSPGRGGQPPVSFDHMLVRTGKKQRRQTLHASRLSQLIPTETRWHCRTAT